MDKIIFLDIDGVLNTNNTFNENNGYRKQFGKILKNDCYNYELILNQLLLDIDYEKLMILKEIVDSTGAKVVITSSWRNLNTFILVEEYLINFGIPIIDCTKKLNKRGEEINNYIFDHNIKTYIIIDDEVFKDFTLEQKSNLIYTNFYNDGLTEENAYDAMHILGLKR